MEKDWTRPASRMLARAAAIGIAAACIALPPAYTSDADSIIGSEAPPLGLQQWVNSPALELQDLEGKVTLIRWWTDTCPFCSTTAPVLNDLQREYGDRGLQVIGIFHPKPAGDASLARLRRATSRFGFTFPVGLDAEWTALKRWWLDREPRGWTSVSFIVDKKGIVRYVHEGGEFHEGEGGSHRRSHQICNRQYEEIRKLIARLLEE